jgi:hypothetical protein
VTGIDDVVYAEQLGALNLQMTPVGLRVLFYPVRRVTGELTLTVAGTAVTVLPADLQPTRPFIQTIPLPPDRPDRGVVAVQILTAEGQPVFQFQQEMALR